MDEEPLILVCDHRGAGLADRLNQLALPGLRVRVSTSLRSSLECLREETPAVCVLDAFAPSGHAELEALDALRGQAPVVPLLIVADRDAPPSSVLAGRRLRDEAWDVIDRDASASEFELRIDRLRETSARLDELDELRYVAVHDDRTDLLRPKAFQERLREHFSAAQRHGFDLVLLVLDLDEFGLINKAFDHTVGDLVIARVGEVIRNALRAEDVAGRLGGDEFAILLPYTHKIDGARVVSRLRREISELTDELADRGLHLRVSSSIGFETFAGNDIESVDELRRHAEAALRSAKSRGGNLGVYYRSIHRAG